MRPEQGKVRFSAAICMQKGTIEIEYFTKFDSFSGICEGVCEGKWYFIMFSNALCNRPLKGYITIVIISSIHNSTVPQLKNKRAYTTYYSLIIYYNILIYRWLYICIILLFIDIGILKKVTVELWKTFLVLHNSLQGLTQRRG